MSEAGDGLRTGAQYIDAIRDDGRRVFIDGAVAYDRSDRSRRRGCWEPLRSWGAVRSSVCLPSFGSVCVNGE